MTLQMVDDFEKDSLLDMVAELFLQVCVQHFDFWEFLNDLAPPMGDVLILCAALKI
jgi:hypothetical protein